MSQLIRILVRVVRLLLGNSGKPQAARILIALIAGLLLGVSLAASIPTQALTATVYVEPIGAVWLNGLRMAIVPLVVGLLITGIAQTAEAARAGRLAARSIVTFIVILCISSIIGALLTPMLLDFWPLDPDAAAKLRSSFV